MPVFCGTELRFGIEIPLIYATAECQNLRIRLVPNSWDSYAGFLWHRALLPVQNLVPAFSPAVVVQHRALLVLTMKHRSPLVPIV